MKRGFTLVELSIVLVIIGLLIGGILVAQSMVETAKITQTVKQIQQFEIAAQNFTTRFDCLPGDCSKPLGFSNGYAASWAFGATDQIRVVGDGDGFIGNYNASNSYLQSPEGVFGGESYNFWSELIQSGDLSYTFAAFNPSVDCTLGGAYCLGGIRTPAASIVKKNTNYGSNLSGGWWVMPKDGYADALLPYTMQCNNAFGLSNGNYAPPQNGVITNVQAAAIDSKIDDGMPLTGKVTAISPIVNAQLKSPADVTASYNCLTGSKYNLNYAGRSNNCGVLICTGLGM